MNKQELIKKWKNKEGASVYEMCTFPIRPSETEMYIAGYGVARKEMLDDLKQLDESKKVVVPKFVADWLDGLKGEISDKKLSSGAAFMVFVGQQLECLYYNEYTLITDDVESWFLHPENKVKLLNAIDNGYEVEKKQLYYVDFIKNDDVHKRLVFDHENGKYNIVDWSDNLIGLVQEIFTEQEIKAIDERYWPFAMKVEG